MSDGICKQYVRYQTQSIPCGRTLGPDGVCPGGPRHVWGRDATTKAKENAS